MKGADNIIPLFSWIVSQMSPVVEIDAITQVGDNWRIDTCNTYWLRKKKVITITGVDFTIEDFVINESITVSGPSIPVGTWFQITAPEFRHGSRRKVNAERDEQTDVTNEFVYLPIPIVRENRQYDSEVVYTAQVKPICICDFDEQYDTIEDQQRDIIEPMNAMTDMLLRVIDENDDKFSQDEEEIAEVERYEWMNFGDETIWGKDKLIFDGNLSGVEARFTLYVLPDGACLCENLPPVTCAPANVYVNDDLVDSAPSGQDFPLIVRDTNGDTPVISYDEPTKKITVPAATTAPVDFRVNGTLVFDNVTTDQELDVVNSDDVQVGAPGTLGQWRIGDTELLIHDSSGNNIALVTIPAESVQSPVVISDSQETLNDDPITPIRSQQSKDIRVVKTNGAFVGTKTVDNETTLEVEIQDSGVTLGAAPLTAIKAEGSKTINLVDAIDFDSVAVTIGTNTEALAEVIVPNGTVNVKDSAGLTLHSKVVKAGGTVNQTVSDSTVNVKDSAGATLHSKAVKAEATADQTVSDSTVNIKTYAGTLLYAKTVKAEATADQTIDDVTVDNSDTSYTVDIPAEGTHVLPDITVTKPNGSTETWPSVKNYACTQINALLTADLISQLTDAQLQAVYEGRVTINEVTYTTPGSTSYNKPSNLLFALVLAIGAGGGGGGGQRRTAGTAAGGGGGGANGALCRRLITNAEIVVAQTVVVGAGGTGGAGRTTDGTQNGGSAGGSSSFGSFVVAPGGNGASTGTGTGGTLPLNSACTPQGVKNNHLGGGGANGGSSAAGGAGTTMAGSSTVIATGAGGGGGATNGGGTTAGAGGNGGRNFNAAYSLTTAATGGAANTNGGNGADNTLLHISLGQDLTTIGYGNPGGGGGASITGNGGNGGNGGKYGMGGGGGGGCLQPFTSGAGGNGADGCVVVIEYLV